MRRFIRSTERWIASICWRLVCWALAGRRALQQDGCVELDGRQRGPQIVGHDDEKVVPGQDGGAEQLLRAPHIGDVADDREGLVRADPDDARLEPTLSERVLVALQLSRLDGAPDPVHRRAHERVVELVHRAVAAEGLGERLAQERLRRHREL